MPRRWTKQEEREKRRELLQLYIHQNLSLNEVASELELSPKTIFKRLKRLNIRTTPSRKTKYLNKRHDYLIPKRKTSDLAEFVGIMIGDGHISHFQIVISLGNKEKEYARHIVKLFHNIFDARPKVAARSSGYLDVYFGSVDLVKWLRKQGLVSNKVKSQIRVPAWVMSRKNFMQRFIKGFFDTDGSIYRLKYGRQIAFRNESAPILQALQVMLGKLKYKPSRISAGKLYLTRRIDIQRFFKEIQPSNSRHTKRFRLFKDEQKVK